MPDTAHETLFAIKVLNDYLRKLLEDLKKRKKKKKRPKRPGRPPKRRGGGSGKPVWVPGSGQAETQVLIDVGGRPQPGDKGPIKKPCKLNGTDRFSIIQYLTCKCNQGDRSACEAASKLVKEARDAANAANSGGGGGGGF